MSLELGNENAYGVLPSSCQENQLNSPEEILRHQISLTCSLCVIDIDNIRPVSDVVLLPC